MYRCQQKTKVIILCILMGAGRTTADPTSNCGEWPGAAGCDGDVVWDSVHSVCECRPLVQTPNQLSNHRVLRRRGKKRHHFDNCYTGQKPGKPKVMLIGILVDRSYYMAAGDNDDSVKRVIYSLVNFGNRLYEEQFDIRMRVGTLYLAKEGHNIPGGKRGEEGQWMNDIPDWEGECKHIKDEQDKGAIDFFLPWVNDNSNDYAMWHLFTDCRGAGPGAAFPGALGKKGRVAFSNWKPVTRHLTFAHETGHVFNAGHTFDEERLNFEAMTGKGIMDYGNGKFEGIIQFHPDHHKYMCPTIEESLTVKDIKNVWASDEKTPSECRCSADLLGNGICDANCNIKRCAFDFGDCDCHANLEPILGNGECDIEANTPQCKYDGGDCVVGINYDDLGPGLCADTAGRVIYAHDRDHSESKKKCEARCSKRRKCSGFSYGGNRCFIYDSPQLKLASFNDRSGMHHCMVKRDPTSNVRPKTTRPTNKKNREKSKKCEDDNAGLQTESGWGGYFCTHSRSYCYSYRDIMRKHCSKFCGFCDPTSNVGPRTKRPTNKNDREKSKTIEAGKKYDDLGPGLCASTAGRVIYVHNRDHSESKKKCETHCSKTPKCSGFSYGGNRCFIYDSPQLKLASFNDRNGIHHCMVKRDPTSNVRPKTTRPTNKKDREKSKKCEDDNAGLQTESGWGGYFCTHSRSYCYSYRDIMRKHCSKFCDFCDPLSNVGPRTTRPTNNNDREKSETFEAGKNYDDLGPGLCADTEDRVIYAHDRDHSESKKKCETHCSKTPKCTGFSYGGNRCFIYDGPQLKLASFNDRNGIHHCMVKRGRRVKI